MKRRRNSGGERRRYYYKRRMSKRSGGVGCGTGSSKREGKKLGFQSHRMMGM